MDNFDAIDLHELLDRRLRRRNASILLLSLASIPGFSPEHPSLPVLRAFHKIDTSVYDANTLVHHFQHANFLEILVLYNYFYPKLTKNNIGIIDKVEAEINRVRPFYVYNQHRLDALPAILSVHLAPFASYPNYLHSKIASTLLSHPLAREMILQNMNSALSLYYRHILASRRLPIAPEVLCALQYVIDDGKDHFSLFHTLHLTLQYLLNVQIVLRCADYLDTGDTSLKDVEELLSQFESLSSRWPEFRIVMKSHGEITEKSVDNIKDRNDASLLLMTPHITEVILGHKYLSRIRGNYQAWHDYSQSMMILYCRMFHSHKILSYESPPNLFDKAHYLQARSSVEKSIEFSRSCNIFASFEADNSMLTLLERDRPFYRFMTAEAPRIIINPREIGLNFNTESIPNPVPSITLRKFPLRAYADMSAWDELNRFYIKNQHWFGPIAGFAGTMILEKIKAILKPSGSSGK